MHDDAQRHNDVNFFEITSKSNRGIFPGRYKRGRGSRWRIVVEGMCGWSASDRGDLRVAMAASICYALG
jgi:hypothetical protein